MWVLVKSIQPTRCTANSRQLLSLIILERPPAPFLWNFIHVAAKGKIQLQALAAVAHDKSDMLEHNNIFNISMFFFGDTNRLPLCEHIFKFWLIIHLIHHTCYTQNITKSN